MMARINSLGWTRIGRGDRACRRAVTFLELMVVIVILSLMTAVAIPSMKGTMARRRLSAAAGSLTSLARYGRQQAIMHQASTELRIDFKKDSYRLRLNPEKKKHIFSTNSGKRRKIERRRRLSKKPKDVYFKMVQTVEDSDDGRGDMVNIRFNKDGSASAATIVIADKSGRTMTLEITAATGALRVSKIKKASVDQGN